MKRCNQFIFALLTLAMSQLAHAAIEPLDRVTVQINEGIILESEVTGMVKTIKANAAEAGQKLPSDQALRTQVIERLILTRLQMQQWQYF